MHNTFMNQDSIQGDGLFIRLSLGISSLEAIVPIRRESVALASHRRAAQMGILCATLLQ